MLRRVLNEKRDCDFGIKTDDVVLREIRACLESDAVLAWLQLKFNGKQGSQPTIGIGHTGSERFPFIGLKCKHNVDALCRAALRNIQNMRRNRAHILQIVFADGFFNCLLL